MSKNPELSENVVSGDSEVVLTRLSPPPRQARLLRRRRLEQVLAPAAEYPLTLLVAPAGSGKTVALTALVEHGSWPAAWHRMAADDGPRSLLLHLAAAFREVAPLDEARLRRNLASGDNSAQSALTLLLNELAGKLHEHTLLVLDDYHLVEGNPGVQDAIEGLIAQQPALLRLVISSRYEPRFSRLPTLRARGEVFEMGQHELALSPDEVLDLSEAYDGPAPPDVEELVAAARGWPLALHAVVADPAARTLQDVESLLDAYLTREVLNQQPPPLREHMLRTGLLRWIDLDACGALPGLAELTPQQAELERRRLFLERPAPDRLAYQPLFRDFLRRTAERELDDHHELHARAAAYYRQGGDDEGAVHHLFAASKANDAAELLEDKGTDWISNGWAEALLQWLDCLPAPSTESIPLLLIRGDANRKLGQYEAAARYYQRAREEARRTGNREAELRSLRDHARIFLDTVQPAAAAGLLEQALDLVPEDSHPERAGLLRMQAENWANSGRPDMALLIQDAVEQAAGAGNDEGADAISTSEEDRLLAPRLLLRSGRLQEARLQLEQLLTEAEPPAPGGHREPSLLLAFVDALLGNAARALAMARRGLLEAEESGASLTQAVAHMRAGHAYQILTPTAPDARRHYERALQLTESVGVARTRAEAYMGMALLHSNDGDRAHAEGFAQEGLRLAEQAGDEWMAALLWLAQGSSGVNNGAEESLGWLEQAGTRFAAARDTYGEALVTLWLTIWHIKAGGEQEAERETDRLLALAREHGYEGLLTAGTLFGPRDEATVIPLLIKARAMPEHSVLAQRLLRQAYPTIASDATVEHYHPGYTLRVRMLGTFEARRGMEVIQPTEWGREKALQLFQLLLTYRGRWLHREQICELLWPETDIESAERQFKVTLNALNRAIEPQRPPRTAPFFIRRRGLSYSFAPSYGAWIDVDEFELRTARAPEDDLDLAVRNGKVAVELYRGDYLAEALYDSWTLEERERLLARFLSAASSLANRLIEVGDPGGAIQLCDEVLRRDPAYEDAYRVLMRAYARAGNRAQALRAYRRCVQSLHSRLDVEPLPATTHLYERIKLNERV